MSLTYEISPAGDRVRIVGKEKMTTRACVRLAERVLTDPRCRADSTALIDLRDAVYEPKDLTEVLDIGREMDKFHSKLKNNIAIVAKRSMLFPAELLCTYIRKATSVGIRVFVDAAAAEEFCAAPNVQHRR